jgi:two-component system, LytTR family, response regulator
MIEARLICGASSEAALRKEIEARGVSLSDGADVAIVERGLRPPETGVCILFDAASPDALLDFLTEAAQAHTNKKINLIVAKKDGVFHPLKIERIMYFSAEGDSVYCHADGARYEVQEKLYALDERLRSKAFIRIHKSFLVNAAWIEEILPWFGGRLLLRFKGSATELEVSRTYLAGFKALLGM